MCPTLWRSSATPGWSTTLCWWWDTENVSVFVLSSFTQFLLLRIRRQTNLFVLFINKKIIILQINMQDTVKYSMFGGYNYWIYTVLRQRYPILGHQKQLGRGLWRTGKTNTLRSLSHNVLIIFLSNHLVYDNSKPQRAVVSYKRPHGHSGVLGFSYTVKSNFIVSSYKVMCVCVCFSTSFFFFISVHHTGLLLPVQGVQCMWDQPDVLICCSQLN